MPYPSRQHEPADLWKHHKFIQTSLLVLRAIPMLSFGTRRSGNAVFYNQNIDQQHFEVLEESTIPSDKAEAQDLAERLLHKQRDLLKVRLSGDWTLLYL